MAEEAVKGHRSSELGRGMPIPHVPLTSGRDEIEDVIAKFAVQAKRLLDHDRLSIYLVTADGLALERFAVATSPPVPGEREIQPLDQVGLSLVVRTNKPVVSADFGTDQRILGTDDLLIASAGYHGLVSVPLRIGKKPFGLLNFVSETPGFYRDDDVAVAQQIADQVAVFLQNLRLQHAVRVAIEREATERERNRVARELHDTALQALSEISVGAEALEKNFEPESNERSRVTLLRQLAAKAHEDVRRSLLSLDPSELEDRSLVDAMTAILAETEARGHIRGRLVVRGDPTSLEPGVQAGVFRIFQEALTNVRRHASASHVVATLEIEDRLSLTVHDDGDGFEPGEETIANGFGIRSMRAQAVAMGGHLNVTSSPGTGTEVSLRVPTEFTNEAAPLPSSERRTLRVLIVDDQPVFREGLGAVLESREDLRVVGYAGTADEALAATRISRPDVIVLDLHLPDSKDSKIVEQLIESDVRPVVVIMSAFEDRTGIEKGLGAGASGFISKTAPAETIIDAIRAASHGSTVLDRSALTADSSEYQLTQREIRILELLASGATNAEIATEVHLANKTVERVVATVIARLGAKNRTHAVARAIALRLMDVSDF
jgi:signal transduction histidine kinase/DNA-binding NarL/FixJ family response regulator